MTPGEYPTQEQFQSLVKDGWRFAPPNPLYDREWICSLDHGRASLVISAPGGVISPQNAQDVLDWLAIIQRPLQRMAEVKSETPTPEPRPACQDQQ